MICKNYSAVGFSVLLITCLTAVSAPDTCTSEHELKTAIQSRSERVLLKEAIAVEQAQTRAQSEGGYGLELRPTATESDARLGLRVYLPDHWSKSKLRQQLAWVAGSEQLRVATLEWQDLMQVYRLFCDYRMLRKQNALFEKEIQELKPSLGRADSGVQLNQFAVADRAKLYTLCLDLVDNRDEVCTKRLDVEQQLYLLLGAEADLARLAPSALIEMPSTMEFDILMLRALNSRSDRQRFDLQAQALTAAESLANSKDNFHLKYIQPFCEMDHDDSSSRWGISASFVLPWGTRNPDAAVYRQQREVLLSAMSLQRAVIQNRLQVLLKTFRTYRGQIDQRDRQIEPLLEQLSKDLQAMNTGRLEELRDVMLVRERILDASLRAVETACRKEKMAVDFAEELGSITP